MPCPESLISRLRYASQVIQTRSQYLHLKDYRSFKVIQGQYYNKYRGNFAAAG